MNPKARASIYLILAFLIGFGTATNPSVYAYLVKSKLVPAPQIVSAPAQESQDQSDTELIDLSSFWETFNTIKGEYVDPEALKQTSKVSYGAAKGLVSSLKDPYSSYLDPKETSSFREDLNGELEGVGIEVTVKDERIVVVTPLRESPGEKAGVLPNDIIYKIDGESTEGMSIHEAVTRIKGKRGTEVVLTVIRETEVEPIDIPITRDKITISSVTWDVVGDNVMLITINQFSDDTSAEFKKAVQEALVQKPKGIIIDLRFNGGGYLESSVNILSELIEGKVKVVSIKGRKEINNRIFYSDGSGRLTQVPLAVLVNVGSASASEIVAGAVQDLQRGIVIGERTFGKGSVQEVFDLSDKSSLILSIAKWYTPNDRNVNEVGLEPDRVVPLTMEDYLAEKDPQLEEAIKYIQDL